MFRDNKYLDYEIIENDFTEEQWEKVKVPRTTLRVKQVTTPMFSQDCVATCFVETGNIRPRESVCLYGTEQPTFEVMWLGDGASKNNEGQQLRIKLKGGKKKISAGQTLVLSNEPRKHFQKILKEQFKDYEILEDVKIAEDGIPVSFLLLKDGQPKVAIILCSSRIYKTKVVLNTMKSCEERNIPVQRYYTDFENQKGYVCNRIRTIL